jgi:flagellar motor switch protein FliM
MNRKRKNRKRQRKAKKDEDAPTEVLSQAEINQLLAAINAVDTEPKDSKPAAGVRTIKVYDFKRPDKFSKDLICAVSVMHDTFARLTAQNLSAQIHGKVHIHVASVDQLTYQEFIRSIPTPTTLAIISMEPLQGNALLEIDPAVTFSVIDRMCGGTGNGTKFQHELTTIEQSIMVRIIVQMVLNLQDAWADVIDLCPRLEKIDTNPQFTRIVPEAEMVVLVTMETKVGDVEGMINLCIPYVTVEPIIDKVSAVCQSGSKKPSPEKYELGSREDAPVTMTAEIFRRNYSINEIIEWKTETVLLPVRPLASGRCYVRLGDRRVWHCEILPENKGFAKQIKILEFADNPFGTEGKEMEMTETNTLVADALANAGITISAEIGTTVKSIKEVFSIGEGTIIELNKLAGEPVDVKANGVLFARGEVVVIDESFGVRITEVSAKIDPLTQGAASETE